MTALLKRLRDEERGSITPVWVWLFVFVLTLSMATAELLHVQYVKRALQMAADRAAEAGGIRVLADGTPQRYSWARMKVQQWQYYKYNFHWECGEWEWEEWDSAPIDPDNPDAGYTEPGGEWVCVDWYWDYDVGIRTRWVEEEAREEDFEGYGWLTVFDCYLGTPWEEDGNWGCWGPPQVVQPEKYNRWITFTGVGEVTARRTFYANWKDRPTARVIGLNVTQNAGTRSTEVVVRAQITPLFFTFMGPRTITVGSQSVVQMRPFSM